MLNLMIILLDVFHLGFFPFLQPEPQKWGQFVKYRKMASSGLFEWTRDTGWLKDECAVHGATQSIVGPGARVLGVGCTELLSRLLCGRAVLKITVLHQSCAFYVLQAVNYYSRLVRPYKGILLRSKKGRNHWPPTPSCLGVSSENYALWIKANPKD